VTNDTIGPGGIACTFDGACEPNPGGAMGWGWTIGEEAFHGSAAADAAPAAVYRQASNNVAEYLALIALLKALRDRGIMGARIMSYSRKA
jgi:ribonuclease HI